MLPDCDAGMVKGKVSGFFDGRGLIDRGARVESLMG